MPQPHRRPFLLRGTALTLLAAVFASSLFLAACGSSDKSAPKLDNPNQTGAELTDEYLTLLKNKDGDGLDKFLSDAFIVQRADGSFSNKADYIAKIPDVSSYSISDVNALQSGDVLVVRWSLSAEEVINGNKFSGAAAPRLSTFAWEDGRWRLTSHANFNAPEQ
jgi:major membrane immunogen (membrane-anchored lipoprotein)